ncbi:MAG: ferredoxin--NADP reductase [Hyphomicrobiaceae bacterium]|nr:ferredoxin--NADP reductase [Hyphomicrobiaceae bacterium]
MQATTAERPAAAPSATKPAKKSPFLRETVQEITHYTDKLFSFRTTRSDGFRFLSGQFTMIGLEVDGKPLMRAYSMASAYYDEFLEFFSIKVPDGPLTSRLQHIKVGDEILVGPKPTGTLLLTNLEPGKRLYLLATGTGFAPFASLLRDPELYERFDEVILVNGSRRVAELEYATQTVVALREHEYLGELVDGKLNYYATVTREPFHHEGRITDLMESGKLFSDLGQPMLDPATDRAMICGNPNMLIDLKAMLEARGFTEGSSGQPGAFVIERAFAER